MKLSLLTAAALWFVLVPGVFSDTVVSAEGVAVLSSTQEQLLRVAVVHDGTSPAGRVAVMGGPSTNLTWSAGSNCVELWIPAVEAPTNVSVTVESGGAVVETRSVALAPVRPMTVYILPHSHTDIGYTELQTEIEDKQVANLVAGIAAAERTKDYPPGARFVWNVEVAWAAELFLQRLDAAQRQAFVDAVKRGSVALNGMYLNELTGLCRPEELLRLFGEAVKLGKLTGVPVESAMISDVPGYTWGTVPAMAQAGVKYFSVAPNFFDRIGDILVQWENKPFYWVGPDGHSQVLVWIPLKGYALSHIIKKLTPRWAADYMTQLQRTKYPYDITHVRWAGHGDNASPDPVICDFVKDWNASHVSPRFVISSTTEAFRALENRHGAQLPRVSGDWTPFWEDGAGSSARETAMNRASSDRLSQAGALFSCFRQDEYPASLFDTAWRDVLLYSEHTWGAWCSVGEPGRRETVEQWAIKQGYAAAADRESRELLSRGLALGAGETLAHAVDVMNTTSWTRSDLVTVPKFLSEGLNRVSTTNGAPVPSQRLTSGELVVWAADVPAFAERRFQLSAGEPAVTSRVAVTTNSLNNGIVSVRVDPVTGGIVELRLAGLDTNFADTADGQSLNEYLYFNGNNPADAVRNAAVTIRQGEKGPLVASLIIESAAPGCHTLRREVRLTAGADAVEIINVVDKARLMAANYKKKEGKESVNFGFPFAVADGQVRVEVPFAVVRPDDDQLPGSCRNWFTAGRWADVSNDQCGVTWITPDAPLVQVGGLTANLIESQSNPDVWRKKVGRTQKLYAWVMNNHWGTNYRAWQDGPHTFRFLLRPHRAYDPAVASRAAIAASQPLLATTARGPARGASRVDWKTPEVLAMALRPADEGAADLLTLWNASDHPVRVTPQWSDPLPRTVHTSDATGRVTGSWRDGTTLPAWGVITVRAELP